ncbi:hypothetical protein CORC01_14209, partial [Colletotrichum orchidophilum]
PCRHQYKRSRDNQDLPTPPTLTEKCVWLPRRRLGMSGTTKVGRTLPSVASQLLRSNRVAICCEDDNRRRECSGCAGLTLCPESTISAPNPDKG